MIRFWKRTNSNKSDRDRQTRPEERRDIVLSRDGASSVDDRIQREIRNLARDQAPGRYRVRVRRKVARV